MRKIEREMVNAVETGQNWSKDNTAVYPEITPDGEIVKVFLHGHHIATRDNLGNITPNIETLRAWPTVTTKSRLRALGVHVYSHKHRVYVDDLPID